MNNAEAFDYIVIGAGSAGCAVAARLSAKARVLLLEPGGMGLELVIQDPAQVLMDAFGPVAAVPYMTTPQPGLVKAPPDERGRQVAIHRGIVRGGSSCINGMIWVHGNPADFDGWEAQGCRGWGYDKVLPIYRRIETWAGGATDQHGASGPVDVETLPAPSAVATAFIAAARALGPFPRSGPQFDYNAGTQSNAAGYYSVNITPDRRRASAAQAYLDPIRGRPSLMVRTGVRVERILLEQGRAVGVRCLVSEGKGPARVKTFRAEGEIVLCAGAFESPAILMRSGIGKADELKAMGIRPVVNLPGVGSNLHDHAQCLTFRMAPKGKDTGQSGFIAEAALFTHSATRSAAEPPDLQFHFLAGLAGFLDPVWTPHFICSPVLLTPQSRGSVRLASRLATDHPVVDPAYLSEPADVQVLARGFELARDLCATASLSAFCSPRSSDWFGRLPDNKTRVPVPRKASDMAAFVRLTAGTVWHPVGTCAMGTGPMSVVDPKLRVRGVEGLRVADGSVMPTITRGNTNAPIIMIGERAADFIAGR